MSDETMPTDAMCQAARGLIMALKMGVPNYEISLADVARSGYYGDLWSHVLTDEERQMTGPLTKGHWAQLIFRAMSAAAPTRDEVGPVAGEGGEAVGVVSGCARADLHTADLPTGTLLYAAPPPPQDDALRIAVEAMKGALVWDKERGYRMPYRVRDPLYAAIDKAALKSTAGQEGGGA